MAAQVGRALLYGWLPGWAKWAGARRAAQRLRVYLQPGIQFKAPASAVPLYVAGLQRAAEAANGQGDEVVAGKRCRQGQRLQTLRWAP